MTVSLPGVMPGAIEGALPGAEGFSRDLLLRDKGAASPTAYEAWLRLHLFVARACKHANI